MERITFKVQVGVPQHTPVGDLPHRSHGFPWSRLWNSIPTVPHFLPQVSI